MDSRAVHEIKSDAHRLCTVRILGAVDAGDWQLVHELSNQLKDIAVRGMFHQSQEKAKTLAEFANRGHIEPEER